MLYPKNGESTLSPELFRDPTAEYRGTPFWAWNNRLEKDELIRQIDVLREMGMGGFHMHSRVGLDTPYLGTEFMEMVQACVKHAQENNMLAWLYDEDRWPSGAAGGRVTGDHRFRARYLSYSPKVPSDSFAPTRDAYEKALAEGILMKGYWLVAHEVSLEKGCLAEVKTYTVFSDALKAGAALAETEEEQGVISRVWHALLCIEADNSWYNGHAYANTLDPSAIGRFLEETHEKYAELFQDQFGKTIPAIFTDEPQFRHKEALRFADEAREIIIPFTDDFPETYLATYGQDLLPVLPELFWELPDGQASLPRYRYHDHLAERFAQAFADQIGHWCTTHNLMLTGHMMAEETLQSQTGALGDAMRSYRSFQLPGIDMLCDSREFSTAKQAQSAANQYGRPGVLSELYGVTGWDFPFKGHKMQGDWQAALGVSVRVHHLSWVSMEGEAKRDYPASINYQSPWHTEYRMVEDYFSRLNTALTRGRPHVRVAAIHPVESYWLHWGPFEQTAPAREALETHFSDLMAWLLPGQLDFDWISESLLPGQCPNHASESAFTGANDRVVFPVGEMAYEVILVPGNHTLRSTTLDRLEAFQQAGGTVAFLGKPPVWVDAVPDDRAQRLAMNCVRVPFTKTDIMSALEPWRDVSVWTAAGTRHTNLLTRIRVDGTARWLFLCHAWDRELQADWTGNIGMVEAVRVRISGEWNPVLHDAMTGEIRPMPAELQEGDTCLDVELSIHDSLLLQLLPGVPAIKPAKALFQSSARVKRPEYADDEEEEEGESVKSVMADMDDPVPVTLSEPNVLLLDMAEYRLDNGDWQPKEEILRIDTKLRQRLLFPLRTDAMVQPWVQRETMESRSEAAPDEHRRLALMFRLQLEVAVPSAELAVEHPETMRILLDGTEVTQRDTGWYVDRCIRKIALPELSAGEHQLVLEMPFGPRTHLEWAYLLGDFGVRVAGRHAIVTAPVRNLAFGDWTRQGLPFYAGNVTYQCPFAADGKSAMCLETPQFGNPVLSVALDGEAVGRIAFAPYRLRIGTPAAGTHELAITAFGNRFNAFGCVHLCNPAYKWFGSSSWRTEGLSWSYQYQLKKMGLLVAPKIMGC